MTAYNILAESNGDNAVVAEYTPQPKSTTYQSEADLEQKMIELLEEQGYEHPTFHTEQALIDNLRSSLEALNDYQFTDAEWDRFYKTSIASTSDGIIEKTRRIQRDHIQPFKRDDGTTRNIRLIDKQDIHRNKLQVINQYVQTDEQKTNRYDVTILVNGLPMIHAELKRRGVSIQDAFNQIRQYSQDSFGAASGLFEYVQIFVISNGTFTKYYANTTRDLKVKQGGGEAVRSSSAFEFTSYWADAQNRPIPDLMDFTRTFLARHTILNVLTKYCIFTEQDMLLVMRPYQIVATERIISRIRMTSELKKQGTIDAGGYIWHTTGSGKTVTSFKTAQLATQLPEIDKVLFVVDRKDLDIQTIREYDRFQKGAANSNVSTKVLQKQLEDPDARIIVTTIQKLDRFIAANKSHPVYGQRVAIIFDECHRSQFGEMHGSITKAFKKYHLFGFTGTPIFAANSGHAAAGTTEQTFGKQLHSYTVVDAINDGNVLPWRIDYVSTMNSAGGDDKQVQAIDTLSALEAPERIQGVVAYTLDHYAQKTSARHSYTKDGRRLHGFNSMFAVQSIPMARRYYDEFQRQIGERKDELGKLKVATIFSFNPNETVEDGILPDENFTTDGLDGSSREFLDRAIADYNEMYGTSFSSSGDSFERYYRDLSLRMKNRELDLLIVVNMFLTGFDAPTMNTLWVDKNLKQHGLIQAFSRTNRILNSVKKYGNIVSFRNLQAETEEALALFGNKDAAGIVLLKNFDAYFQGYDDKDGKHHAGYVELVSELTGSFQPGEVIQGEERKKEFVRLFGSLLRLRNILTSFNEFEEKDPLPAGTMQDYQSMYIDLYKKLRPEKAEKEDIQDDIVFEMELVRHLEVTIDYILELVQKYSSSLCQDKEVLDQIRKAVDSSVELRSKRELIERFLSSVDPGNDQVAGSWQQFVVEEREKDLQALIQEENLRNEETRMLLLGALETGSLRLMGRWFDEISMKRVSRFGGGRAKQKLELEQKLMSFFERYADTL